MTDYYNLLGVTKNASDDEIKKKYKKLAMKHHPDRNKDNKEQSEKTFKEISNAYNVLSDKKKRQIYDQFGEEGLQGAGSQNFNPFSMFEEMFGDSDHMSGMGGFPGMPGFHFNMNNMNRQQQKPQKQTEVKKIKVSLEDLYKGKKLNLKITRTFLDNSKKKYVKTCDKCNGSGVETIIQRIGPMIQQMQNVCSKCGGSGKILDNKYLENKSETIQLNIEQGMCDKEQILFENKGNFNIKTMENNDLVFLLIEEPHNIFKRVQNNLVLGLDINFIDSIIGFSFLFKHLDNTQFIISSDDIIKNNEVKVIKNKGMPYNSSYNVIGDLIIKFNIIYPKSIDFKHHEQLKNIFGNSIFNNINNFDNYDNITLQNYNKQHYENQQQEDNDTHNVNQCTPQ